MNLAKPAIVMIGVACVAVALLATAPWKGGPVPAWEQRHSTESTKLREAIHPEPAIEREHQVLETPAIDDAAGRVWMGIGDVYTFGGEVLRRRQLERDEFDIYCQDIRHDVSLHCPEGAVSAVSPVSSVGLPNTAASAAALVIDAPLYLARRDLMLTEQPTLKLPGVGFVKARNGAVYRLHVEQLEGHPDALRRRALIRYERVPQAEHGGVLRLPAVEGTVAPEENTPYLLSRAVTLGNAMPGTSFTSYIDRKDHATVERLDGDLTIKGEHLIVKEPIQSHVRVNAGSLIIEGRIETGATVELLSGSGLAVGGDVYGNIRNSGYGFMYIRGDLYGEMTHESYATAVIEGDVIGTLHIKSYSDVLIRGRLLGTLDVQGSCWSTIYVESFISRQELLDMKGNFHQITLHLASSDIPPGEHEGIGSWQSVIVGAPVWRTLIR